MNNRRPPVASQIKRLTEQAETSFEQVRALNTMYGALVDLKCELDDAGELNEVFAETFNEEISRLVTLEAEMRDDVNWRYEQIKILKSGASA